MEESFCPKCGDKITPVPVIVQKSIHEKSKELRQARISEIKNGHTPIELRDGPKTVLHLLPYSYFDDEPKMIELDQLNAERGNLRQLFSGGYNSGYSYEGYLTYDSNPPVRSYSQAFRKGGIEAVDAYMIGCNGAKKLIPITAFEGGIIESLGRFLPLLQRLNVEPPLFLALSLLGIRGYKVPTRGFSSDTNPIQQEDLILHEVIIENFDVEPAKVLKSLFDIIWNASGFRGSINYKDGEWVESQ